MNDEHPEAGDWVGADLNVNPSVAPEKLFKPSASFTDELWINDALFATTPLDQRQQFNLVDDYLYSLSDPMPLDLTLATSVLHSLYIRVVVDAPDEVNTPATFIKNATFDDQSTWAAEQAPSLTYWALPIRAAFEGDINMDGDGESAGAGGRVAGQLDETSTFIMPPNLAVFMESVRDLFRNPEPGSVWVSEDEAIRVIVAHEMGHALGLIHNGNATEGGPMCGEIALRQSTGQLRTSLTLPQKASVRAVKDLLSFYEVPAELITCQLMPF